MPAIIMENIENSFFLVPSDVVDKYIDNATHNQLKILLYLLRNSGRSSSDDLIAANLNITVSDLTSAINFWLQNGVLVKNGERISLSFGVSNKARPEYNSETIAFKINNNSDLSKLIEETERIFGKLLSPSDINILIGLNDWTGINPNVILTIVEYCCSNNKKGMKYIEKTANEWFEAGIDTIEKAEIYIKKQNQYKSLEYKISKILGASERALTETEKKNILVWINEYNFTIDIISKAYELTVDKTGKYSISYMNTILRNWNEKGYKTLDDTEQETAPMSKSGKKKKSNLDVDTIMKYSWDIVKNHSEE